MNKFINKRDSLESYVKEQVIGPGAYNKKYFFLKNWEESVYVDKDLSEVSALENFDEIIPEVPAYQYSSAILFPLTTQSNDGENNEQEENDTEEENEETDVNTSADDENVVEDTSSNVVLTQQNYPTTFGISFVFDNEKDINQDLKVSLSYRKYQRISKKNLLENKIAIQIKEYKTEIKEIVEKYLGSLFLIESKSTNVFILPSKIFNNTEIYNIDYSLMNRYVEEEFIPILNNTFNNELVELNNTDQERYFGLGNNQFYYISDSKHGHTNVYTILFKAISGFIKNELEQGIDNYSKYKNLIKALEIYKQLMQITTDLKTILKEKKSSPIWRSEKFTKEISLPEVKGDLIQRENRKPIDENDKKSLQYYVQYYIPNPDDNKVYVKLLIENINEYKLDINEPPQLNKKNKANELSFFGVELSINETIKNSLLQYNPPQLLDFDEEDSFNKLLYREYIDLGEGYNTSVNWGKNEDNLNFISSEFLPIQETPSVDFKPSKIINGEIKDRLEDDNILSMRYLSTLSNSPNATVIIGLNAFIDAYGNEKSISWIKDKQEALDTENLDDKSKDLLNKQLMACRNDYKRLKRNISLLENNDEALAAFRTMNTAMFMQLHHSIKSKGKIPFVPNNEDVEAFYSKEIATDKEGNVTEYKWRSFQLAFILLNIDAFVKPEKGDSTVEDVFGSGWPERNEIADLVWFPTGGGKTEAYFGIIAFVIALRRFTKGEHGYGTTVLMRYTLRMLTLQQFQRATLLICALEVIRKDNFTLPNDLTLGEERITIGLFVGEPSLPNNWKKDNGNNNRKGMIDELQKISDSITNSLPISTKLPFTDCPWCGGDLFVDQNLNNISPNHTKDNNTYGLDDQLNIACNTGGCTFYSKRSSNKKSLPLRLFDEDIYKYPPTLLFGTVDKFAAFANNVSNAAGGRNKDSQRLIGKGYHRDVLPPELIIQDELHLLLGPLGSSVGLFEKSIDYLCTYNDGDGNKIKPKVVTSTATTRNTDKQIFALFNRRSEIFPKQGITCDDSFFAFYKRKKTAIETYESKRKYVGVLPIGKTKVWMQLRIISITLSHRLKYFKEKYTINQVFENPSILDELKKVFDYYHTVLAYYNSLKDVGKAQSQLDHYLPGDISSIIKNTIPWSFLDSIIRSDGKINYSELTGRLSGEEVKTNLADIEKKWSLLDKIDNGNKFKLNKISNPEFIIATNMISVGIDVSRFNTIVINSMPRNIAEYIQASSRVARDEDGIVFTVHHPFRSRDISHYQKFKEFHEKFYSYVEPISVTPFASKALDRYLAMYAIVIIRHNEALGLMNNEAAREIDNDKIEIIKALINEEIQEVYNNSLKLDAHLQKRTAGVTSTIDGIISQEEVDDINFKLNKLLNNWISLIDGQEQPVDLNYRIHNERLRSLFTNASDGNRWKVSHSLREIGASAVIKTVQQ